jgi:hypothetical protein
MQRVTICHLLSTMAAMEAFQISARTTLELWLESVVQ